MKNTRKIIYAGILIGLEIVLTRFVQIPLNWIPILNLSKDRISLGFLPVALSGILLGPIYGGVIAGIADVIRAIILPVGGAFNPLFTISAVLRGVIYGLVLGKKQSFTRVVLASLIIYIFVNNLLNTLFVHYSYGTPFYAFFTAKIFINTINFIVQVIILNIVAKPIKERTNI